MNAEFLKIANKLGLYIQGQIQDVPNEHGNEYRVLRIDLNSITTAVQLEQALIELQQSDQGYYFIDDYDLGVFLEAYENFEEKFIDQLTNHFNLIVNKDDLENFRTDYVILIEISRKF
ncbi:MULTISPECIES: hypothetical protein [Acinetobacter]|uniref:hypothetical protein n=1 Tax=Acinetobacter TaxID=469 RepID=UPI002FE269AD